MILPKYDIGISWLQNETLSQANFIIGVGVTALIGPSGAGKTTIARMIAGLAQPDNGKVYHGPQVLFDKALGVNMRPCERSIGYVTQEPALFPTMTVEKNILLSAQISQQEIQHLCAITNITDLLRRNPQTLSGGEARRVSIVRALAAKPKLLILDEPMNGLDPKLRKSLLTLIRKLSHQTNTPTLLITHQIEEMLTAADHAVLMANNCTPVSGNIEHVLSASETSEYLGIDDAGSILEATVSGRADGLLIATIGAQKIWLPDDGEIEGSKLRLRILSRDVGISAHHLEQVSMLNQLEVKISNLTARAQDQLLTLSLKGSKQILLARITGKSVADMQLTEGTSVHALVKAVAVKEVMIS